MHLCNVCFEDKGDWPRGVREMLETRAQALKQAEALCGLPADLQMGDPEKKIDNLIMDDLCGGTRHPAPKNLCLDITPANDFMLGRKDFPA